MNFKIINYYADSVPLWILVIQLLQKFNVFPAFHHKTAHLRVNLQLQFGFRIHQTVFQAVYTQAVRYTFGNQNQDSYSHNNKLFYQQFYCRVIKKILYQNVR